MNSRNTVALAACALSLFVSSAESSILTPIYAFQTDPTDGGSFPMRPLTIYNGQLYGTTCNGGFATTASGTSFRIDFTGSNYTKLHDYDHNADGECPSEIIFHGQYAYGTTRDSNGATDRLARTKKTAPYPLTNLYPFTIPQTGQDAEAGVIYKSPYYYGTTTTGGVNTNGVVYRYDGTTVMALHPFAGPDGAGPDRALLYNQGSLYGTTRQGGASNFGTVFQMDLSGNILRQYAFPGGTGGEQPSSPPVKVGQWLYGVTRLGGDPTCSCGTIYRIKLNISTFVPQILYTFKGHSNNDGEAPSGKIVVDNGVVYGTTEKGGIPTLSGGTAYGVNISTHLKVAYYALNNASEGGSPFSGLVENAGLFYGTARAAGANSAGTIFQFQP